MHCRACDSNLTEDKPWKIFNDEYEGPVPSTPDDLCQTCLNISKLAYSNLKHSTHKEIIYECRQMFYKQFVYLDDLVGYLQTDPEYNTLTVEDI